MWYIFLQFHAPTRRPYVTGMHSTTGIQTLTYSPELSWAMNDYYVEDRSVYAKNEVVTVHNASLQTAVAALIMLAF